MHTEATSLKQNTVYNSSGVKCHILDLSQFPEELKIDSVEWHEAWQRYMMFQDTYSDTEDATRTDLLLHQSPGIQQGCLPVSPRIS